MKCPFCAHAGSRPELHAHLTDFHPDEVKTRRSASGTMFFVLSCPLCDAEQMQQVKPRSQDPSFLEDHAKEIRVVAFDGFLYHLQLDHKEDPGA